MKLYVNYDLLDKIAQSQNGTKLYNSEVIEIISDPIFKFPAFCLAGVYIFCFSFDKEWFKVLEIMGISILLGGLLITKNVLKKLAKTREEIANFELQDFANSLQNLEVETTAELLKKSKLKQTNYEIVYKGNTIPRLKQYKYIDVPLSNGYEETILQEYVYGDDIYEISVKSPQKNLVHKLSKKRI